MAATRRFQPSASSRSRLKMIRRLIRAFLGCQGERASFRHLLSRAGMAEEDDVGSRVVAEGLEFCRRAASR